MLRCCSKRVGLWLSYRLANTSMLCFRLSRQLYLAASDTKGTRRVCTLPLHRETDPRLDWLQEHAVIMEKLIIQWGHFYTGWHSRNMDRTDKILSKTTPFAQFCHTSFMHSSLLVCSWYTHFFPPVQSQLAHCFNTLISAIPLNPSHNLYIPCF